MVKGDAMKIAAEYYFIVYIIKAKYIPSKILAIQYIICVVCLESCHQITQFYVALWIWYHYIRSVHLSYFISLILFTDSRYGT